VKLVGLAWLSDSKGLVVSASKNYGVTQLWHLSYPGGVARRVTNDLSDYDSVSLTADSSRLAAVQVNARKNIWTAPLDGSGDARQITTGIGRYDGHFGVAWVPDGRIVYHSLAGGNPDIWIMNGDGSGQKQLTSGGINTWPAVTPDGRHVLFTLETAREPPAIWRMDPDGANQRRIAEGGFRPYSSPDSRWAVYADIALRRAPVEGGPAITLPQPERDIALSPVVSPDGKLIACSYVVGRPGAQFRIGVVPFEGGPPVKVFDIIIPAMAALRWTPDSRALLYVVTREGVSNIWRLPLDGGAPTQITNFKSDTITFFDLSPDGKRLVMARGGASSDVVLINDLK
jgi:Tol biopolymer transport system component